MILSRASLSMVECGLIVLQYRSYWSILGLVNIGSSLSEYVIG